MDKFDHENLREEFDNLISEMTNDLAGMPMPKKEESLKPDNEDAYYAVNNIILHTQIPIQGLETLKTANDWKYFYEKIKADIDNQIEFQIEDIDAFFSILNNNFSNGNSELKLISAKLIAIFISQFGDYVFDILSYCVENINEETSQIILSSIIQAFPALDSSLPEIALKLKDEYFVTAIQALINEGIELPNHQYIIEELLKVNGSKTLLTIMALSPTFAELSSTNAINYAFSFFTEANKKSSNYTEMDLDIAAKFLFNAYRSEGGVCPPDHIIQLFKLLQEGLFTVKKVIISLFSKLLPDESNETFDYLFENDAVEVIINLIDSMNESYIRTLKQLLKILLILMDKDKERFLASLDPSMVECIENIVSYEMYPEIILALAQQILDQLE